MTCAFHPNLGSSSTDRPAMCWVICASGSSFVAVGSLSALAAASAGVGLREVSIIASAMSLSLTVMFGDAPSIGSVGSGGGEGGSGGPPVGISSTSLRNVSEAVVSVSSVVLAATGTADVERVERTC